MKAWFTSLNQREQMSLLLLALVLALYLFYLFAWAPLINESTSRLQLPVIRLQPNSQGEIQVRLENAVFDDVLKWLYEMEYTEHMLVREVSLTQANAPGLVNITARIAEAG